MYLDLERAEESLLVELVQDRIRALDMELDRAGRLTAPTSNDQQQAVKDEQELLERLLHRLHEAEFDVTC
jgi:hypothetical protein